MYKLIDNIDDVTISTKKSFGTPSRFGAALKLGIEGELLDPVYVKYVRAKHGAINLAWVEIIAEANCLHQLLMMKHKKAYLVTSCLQ